MLSCCSPADTAITLLSARGAASGAPLRHSKAKGVAPHSKVAHRPGSCSQKHLSAWSEFEIHTASPLHCCSSRSRCCNPHVLADCSLQCNTSASGP